MENEVLTEESIYEELTAIETWEKLYNKELNCKKHILEYIEITKVLKKENVSNQKIEETYHYIYESIDGLKDLIKPNTTLHLKNTLKAQLGKYVKEKDPNKESQFIAFFKKAYPKDRRRKDFTRVLTDLDSISEEQLWTTLTYINKEYLNNNLRLDAIQKHDIADVIRKAVSKNNIKFITKLRSLRQLTDHLKIRIEKDGKNFKVK